MALFADSDRNEMSPKGSRSDRWRFRHGLTRLLINCVLFFVIIALAMSSYWLAFRENEPGIKGGTEQPAVAAPVVVTSTEPLSRHSRSHVGSKTVPTLSHTAAVVQEPTATDDVPDKSVEGVDDVVSEKPKASQDPVSLLEELTQLPLESQAPESPDESPHSNSSGSPDIPDPVPGTHRLVTLVSMDSPDTNLCKLIFSGMANGYPSPVIVNWGNVGNKLDGGLSAKSHIFKIIKSLEYLDEMMRDTAHPDDRIHDDDLIIIVDATDLWWQLPPEVLIKRYHNINREANERLAKQWGLPGRMPMEQTIIGAAQKQCWPGSKLGFNMHCSLLPESPEREDLYGPETDKGSAFKNRCFTLNSGTVIGPARTLRRLLRRAVDRVSRIRTHHPEAWSDQGALGEVFGEQEIFRTWLREQPNRGDEHYLNNLMMQMMRDNYDYSFGLDYRQRIAIARHVKENDGSLVKLNNQSYIDDMSAQRGIDPVRLRGVPDDMASVQTPLQKLLPDQDTGGWGDFTLYADFYTEAVPAIVHFNGEKFPKVSLTAWWDKMWYFPYLRKLVTKYLERPTELPVLGEYVSGEHRVSYTPLPSELVRRKARMWSPAYAKTGLPEMEFAHICTEKSGEKAWYDEIFRDGFGPV